MGNTKPVVLNSLTEVDVYIRKTAVGSYFLIVFSTKGPDFVSIELDKDQVHDLQEKLGVDCCGAVIDG
jgi:hypothetical protein